MGRYAADLFDARAGVGRPVGRRPWMVGVLAVVAGTVVSLLRQGGAGALDTVWAEDRQIFLSQAHELGPVPALATSYAGYFHEMPRLTAALAAALPVSAAAAKARAAMIPATGSKNDCFGQNAREATCGITLRTFACYWPGSGPESASGATLSVAPAKWRGWLRAYLYATLDAF